MSFHGIGFTRAIVQGRHVVVHEFDAVFRWPLQLGPVFPGQAFTPPHDGMHVVLDAVQGHVWLSAETLVGTINPRCPSEEVP